MKIIFLRADGNAKIGMGHLMRLMTVAEHFDRHTRVVFLCADEISAETVRNHGFEARALGTSYQNMESEIPVLQKIMAEYAGAADPEENGVGRAALVVDSYYVTKTYLERVGEFATVILMDDLQNTVYPVDGIVNYNCFADEDWYREHYPEGEALIGSAYIPLRKQFQNLKTPDGKSIENILITTGGGDVENIGGMILKRLYSEKLCFHIVLGQFSPGFEAVSEFAKDKPNIRIHKNVENMAELMQSCELGITAGGTTVYEMCAAGLPFLCFSYAENQNQLVDYIGRHEIASSCGFYEQGPEKCLKTIEEKFREALKNPELCKEYILRERKLTDGNGAVRLAGGIEKISGLR